MYFYLEFCLYGVGFDLISIVDCLCLPTLARTTLTFWHLKTPPTPHPVTDGLHTLLQVVTRDEGIWEGCYGGRQLGRQLGHVALWRPLRVPQPVPSRYIPIYAYVGRVHLRGRDRGPGVKAPCNPHATCSGLNPAFQGTNTYD
jgi:hypothetical protein